MYLFDEIYALIKSYANFEDIAWWVIDYEQDPDYFYCNEEMKHMFSLDPDKEKFSIAQTCPIAGDYNKHIRKADKMIAATIFAEYQELLDNKRDTYKNYFPYQCGSVRKYFNSQARVLKRDASGKVQLIYGVIQDVTHERNLELQLQKEKQKYKKLSEIDPLTQLMNRRKYEILFAYQFETANRMMESIAVIMLDIDYFKRLNDALGHQMGDLALQQTGQILDKVFSRKNDNCARYGGEEFIVSIYCNSTKTLQNKLQQLQQVIHNTKITHPDSPVSQYLTLSMGACFYDPKQQKSTDREVLIKIADNNLYQAKAKGRNDMVISQYEMTNENQRLAG